MLSHLQTAYYHLRRTPYQSLATVVVITLSMALISFFTLIAVGAETTLRSIESQPQVIAFFDTAPENLEIEQLKAQILGVGDIKEITYISQDQALKIYRETNKDEPLLLEMVTADILPASIEVSAYRPETLDQVAQILNLHENIEDVFYEKEVINQLIKWAEFLRILGIFFASTIAVVTFLTIFIIIGMKIRLRQTEVEILKLLGATASYIQWPFILEAWFYGVLGSLFGWGIAYTSLLYATPHLLDLIWSFQLLPVSYMFMLQVLGIEILAAGVWCALASAAAVNRYLKKF